MAEVSYATTSQGQQVLILREGASVSRSKRVRNNNLAAAKLLAEIVSSSLGPKGMDKMLVDSMGDVTITNDGATMLKDMDVQHPVAKMVIEVAKTVDSAVGDGTTSAVVFAGALLGGAENLMNRGVHPMTIANGYSMAAHQAQRILDKISVPVAPEDVVMLERIASTSMASKLVSGASPLLASLVVEAVLQVAEKASNGDMKVDAENVKVEKKSGGSLKDTTLVRGIMLDKEVVHQGMPKRVKDAKIALISSALEIEKLEFDAKINIETPGQVQQFLDAETKMLRDMADKISGSGANVVICQKGIEEVVQAYLGKKGILALRRVKESDMVRLAKATGAKIANSLDDLSEKELGQAKLVEERKIEEDKWTFVEGCKNPKAVTIFVRGGTQRVVDEAERCIHDAIMVTKDVVIKPAIVGGGGAIEEELSRRLMDWSATIQGREQLVVESFADALESIPLALAMNAGFDQLDIQVALREKHSDGKMWYGVDVLGNGVQDMFRKDVLEPVSVKEQIIRSATECACMLLRVDEVLSSGGKGSSRPAKGPGTSGTED
jgi:archaeal chaperonin